MKRVCSILFILTIVACSSGRLIDVYDGFESNILSRIWSNKKFLPGAFEIQSTHVRSGLSAAKITLNPGDQIDKEKGTILERAELMEARRFMSAEQQGRIKAWLNDRQIIDYTGVTAYSQIYGYPIHGRFYFKMGLYRDKMEQPMTIYLDEYKKQQLME